MNYIYTAVISFLAGAVLTFIYHKNVVAQIKRTQGQAADAARTAADKISGK